MYLFNRTIETTGEMAKIIPILHDLKKAVLATGVDATVWLGGAGYKMGTVIFTTPYENLADRAEANTKLGASEAVMEANQKLISCCAVNYSQLARTPHRLLNNRSVIHAV